jgi:hypothetical protein
MIPIHDDLATRHKAIVILRNAHNHPMHPKIKPSAEDCRKLGAAVQAAGLTGLTTMKFLNGEFCTFYFVLESHNSIQFPAPSTTLVYGGDRVADQSLAFTDTRKVRDFISAAKKKEHPDGMEFDGMDPPCLRRLTN